MMSRVRNAAQVEHGEGLDSGSPGQARNVVRRFRRRVSVWATSLGLLALLLSGPAIAVEPAAEIRANLASLIKQNGSVRVIFSLTEEIKVVDLSAASTASKQLSAIRAKQDALLATVGKSGAALSVTRFSLIPVLAMDVDERTLSLLYANPNVHHIIEDEVSEPQLSDSTTIIGADQAWADEYIGTGYAVAVIDTGVGPHPFLDGRIVSEACYSAGGISLCPGGAPSSTAAGSAADCGMIQGCGHGTHVAGIAAGRSGLGGVLNGVAYGSDIIAIKAVTETRCEGEPCATFTTSNWMKGLERVLELSETMNIAAVNMSLGSNKQTSTCDQRNKPALNLINALKIRKIATVIASGNLGLSDGTGTPACIDLAITVGSTTKMDVLGSGSNSAPWVDLLAPGARICSSVMNGNPPNGSPCSGPDYGLKGGTSMAAPHVAGAWALMRSRNHQASVDEIRAAFISTGVDVAGRNENEVFKRIDVAAAIQAISGESELSDDDPVTNLAWQSSPTQKMRFFYIDVPVGRNILQVTTADGSGNADLFVRLGEKPTSTIYRCASQANGNTENCVVPFPEAGRWFIGLRPSSAYSGLTLTATFTRPARSMLVRSLGETGVPIEVFSGPSWGGTTNYLIEDIVPGTSGSLRAPLMAPSGRYIFNRWLGCDAIIGASLAVCEINFQQNRQVVALYSKIARNIRVRSNIRRLPVDGSPAQYSGETYSDVGRWYDVTAGQGDVVSLTAPPAAFAATFNNWSGCDSVSGSGNRTCNLTMTQNKNVLATYDNPGFNTSVTVTNVTGVQVEYADYFFLTPLFGTLNAPWSDTLDSGEFYTYRVPATGGGLPFSGWTGCDSPQPSNLDPVVVTDVEIRTDCEVLIDGPENLVANYAAGDPIGGFIDDFAPGQWAFDPDSTCTDSDALFGTDSIRIGTDSCAMGVRRYQHVGAAEAGLVTFDYAVIESEAHSHAAALGVNTAGSFIAEDEAAQGQVSLAVGVGERVVLEVTRSGGVGRSELVITNLVFTRNAPPTIPDAPVIGTAALGDGQISVLFTPASNGGSALLDFTATCGSVSQSGSTSPIVVTGLVNGVTYTCTVVARNARGTSPPSAESNSVTPGGVPQAPIIGVVTPIRAGGSHSCALGRDGGVHCWGSNSEGQLGDGTTTDQALATPVSGLQSGVTAIATGLNHSCALSSAGGVKCWGSNDFGQLGDGSTTDRSTPVDVSGLAAGVQAISAGANHSCALTAANGIRCWGRNLLGQLGDGSTTDRSVPVDVSGLGSGVAQVVGGDFHSCARGIAGEVKCWGWNVFGQLGDGSNSDRLTPVTVTGLGSAAQVAAGSFHSCAVDNGGALYCWGRNDFGQIGDGSTTNRNSPIAVSGLSNGARAVDGGSSHSCALLDTGAARCWGLNNSGQLGDGTTIARNTPVAVGGLFAALTNLSSGSAHNCGLDAQGFNQCWGNNASGQLGDGSVQSRSLPAPVFGLTTLAAVPGDGSVTVVFAPGASGASAILDYTASCGGVSQTGSGSPITVAGLVNGTEYTCTVVARNSVGTSLPSSPSNNVTPRAASTVSLSGPSGSSGGTVVTFTATVTGSSPTGSVRFKDGAETIPGCDAVAMVAQTAECSTDQLSAGPRSITAAYSGDNANIASESVAFPHTVTASAPAAPTIDAVTPGNAQISVAFTPGPDGGEPVIDFTASCGGVDVVGVSAPIVVTGLANGTPYSCTATARNSLGTGPASLPSAVVTPATVPASPTQIAASAGDGQVTVTFSPPSDDGGSAIIDYTASCVGQNSTDTNSPIIVAGLTNGLAVSCSVRANNAIGSSPPSQSSNSVTPKALTSTQLTGPSSSDFGAQVSFVATVTGIAPAGSVRFLDGVQPIEGCDGVILNAGSANCSTAALPVGERSITAEYAGDSANQASLSMPLAHTVTATVPAAPIIGLAIAGDGLVEVSFSAGSDGGSPILDFVATCGASSATGAATPIVVNNLQNGVAVTCIVSARNAVGTGPDSAASNSVTPSGVPGAPQLNAVTPGDGVANVAFSPPGDNGGSAIINYTASCAPGPFLVSGIGSPLQVTGLTNGQIYSCSVAANNAAGAGPSSASLNVIPTVTFEADVSISKSNGTDFVSGGLPTDYYIEVANLGPAGVASVRVVDTLDPLFSLSSWSCVAQNGAQCEASGMGNIDTLVDLPAGSSVGFVLTATVAALPESTVSNITSAVPPAEIVDPDLDNNVANDGPDTVGIYRASFE